MLKQTLISINKVLDNLITITKQDIEDIKLAVHTPLFERNREKDKLVAQFSTLKSQIDSILVERNKQGIELDDMLNSEESELLDIFREKLKEFYTIHKKFAKMALVVTNFYNNLVNKINGNEVDIGYKVTKRNNNYSTFSLKA